MGAPSMRMLSLLAMLPFIVFADPTPAPTTPAPTSAPTGDEVTQSNNNSNCEAQQGGPASCGQSSLSACQASNCGGTWIGTTGGGGGGASDPRRRRSFNSGPAPTPPPIFVGGAPKVGGVALA